MVQHLHAKPDRALKLPLLENHATALFKVKSINSKELGGALIDCQEASPIIPSRASKHAPLKLLFHQPIVAYGLRESGVKRLRTYAAHALSWQADGNAHRLEHVSDPARLPHGRIHIPQQRLQLRLQQHGLQLEPQRQENRSWGDLQNNVGTGFFARSF